MSRISGGKKGRKLWIDYFTFIAKFYTGGCLIFVWVHRVVFINASYIKHLNSLLCYMVPLTAVSNRSMVILWTTDVKPDIPRYAYIARGSIAEKHPSWL